MRERVAMQTLLMLRVVVSMYADECVRCNIDKTGRADLSNFHVKVEMDSNNDRKH